MKHTLTTKALCMLLALIMVLGMLPAATLAAGVDESLVSSLAEVYDGDEARAREELEALYDAGLMNEDGTLVELDIREDGESVGLEEVAKRIADGEEVGALTVNGNAVTQEKLLQLQQVSSMLEVIRLIDKDVEITDEHVSNLQSLLEGIADGSIDLSDVISRGEVALSAPKRTMRLLGAGNTPALPENTGSGTVDATDGKYTAPMIDGNTYTKGYSFSLLNPDNTTWYTTNPTASDDAASDDPASSAVVTISCEKTAIKDTFFTVTATLNAAQSVPVSFDWTVISGFLRFSDGSNTGPMMKGTVKWEANDSQLTKTFRVMPYKPYNVVSDTVGTKCFIINFGNITNATFEDGKTTLSKTVQVDVSDNDASAAILAKYPVKTVTIPVESFTAVQGEDRMSKWTWYYTLTEDVFSPTADFAVKLKSTENEQVGFFYLTNPNAAVTDNNIENQLTKNGPYFYAGTEANQNIVKSNGNFVNGTLADIVLDGKAWVGIQFYGTDALETMTVEISQFVTKDEIVGVSALAGTYYSGQTVPITVNLKYPAVATDDVKLTVNGVDCPILNSTGTESTAFTFGYTVKEADGVALNVTALSSGLTNRDGAAVTLEPAFTGATIGTADGVILSSDTKLGGLDWASVKYGIDDADAGNQTVTVVIPFKADAAKDWIANESVEINPPASMSVPGYDGAAAGAYLTSAYFSADGGTTRYPIYVIGENEDALAVRFSPAQNASSFLRKDTLCLYLDTEVGTETNYLGQWADKQVDGKGFAYFTATESEAPKAKGKSVSYFVKGCVLFDDNATIDRPDYDEANKLSGFYKSGAEYVVVQGEDYSKQHDVELVANEALYNAALKGARIEEPNTMVLNIQFSDRDDFTYKDPKNFTWSSSNELIAAVVKDEQTGAGQIALMGGSGNVTITLTVGNGSESKAYDLTFTFGVLEGKTPFLKIPDFSVERVTLTDTDTDVLFSSNVTARNAEMGTAATTFTAKLYQNSVEGKKVWENSFPSTMDETLTHITVPGTAITEPGRYAVVISTTYVGGEKDGVVTNSEDLSATAYLTVKQAPLKVTLKALDSYSADYNELPTIEYTVTPSNANADVKYTIQKSGAAVGEPIAVTGGVIPFTAGKPDGLKEAYTITVYAKAKDAADDEPWSVDSMLLRVYNMDTLELIIKDVIAGEIGGTTGGVGASANGNTVTMDNHSKVEDYPRVEGKDYQLSVSDLNALRTDMSLQKIISANYGTGVWGLLSDKMQWESSDSDLVSINYKQGGLYSDISNYSYTSYGPATDFLLVGKDKTNGVTIKATHAGTGKSATVTVAANTLKDQLYVFQFNPKVETDVVYTNGADNRRTLKSDENGVLAVYEPEGIKSAVMAMSKKDGDTYVGTIYPNELQSGERDIASLQLYPCNNLNLRSISNVTLTFRTPNGSTYNGDVILRAGVYKNGIFCPDAKVYLTGDSEGRNGGEDIKAEVGDGKLTIGFNPMEFKNDPQDSDETGAFPGDKVTYVIEYSVEGYQTSYALINVYTDVDGEQKPMDSVVQLNALRGSANAPQITRQTIQQYSGETPLSYTRDVADFSENIGLSKKIDKVVLTTDYVLPESLVNKDGEENYSGEFSLYTASGKELTGQKKLESTEPKIIINLSEMKDSELFKFPFSSSPIGRHVYTMTDADMEKDGISDVAEGAVVSSRVKAMFVRDGMTLASVTLPFNISNLSHQDPEDSVDAAADSIDSTLKSKMSIGEIFKSINVNDMLKKGFAFLGGLSSTSGDMPFSMLIVPTEDPGVFRLVAFIGKNHSRNKGNDDGQVKISFDTEKMAEDLNDLLEDNNGKVDASFSGTLILEAGYDFNKKEWVIDFRGGSVNLAFSASYEWTQNFMCGPVPATISFEVGANAELEVSFASKSAVRLMLVDATVGVYIEAFAGLGFDATIAKLKLGIYGRIGADVNFLLLSDFNDVSNGTKLDINGEIGIRLEVKLLFVEYKKTFASTGFNWAKTWNDYNEIQARWEKDGNAELFGVTRSGRAYSMRLLANGKALVTIEGGGEIEDRDYLDLAERKWNDGTTSGMRLMKAAGPLTNVQLNDVQTNAYPYSNPVLVDDGSMFLYISDNNNAKEVQSVVSYAVKNVSGYTNKGALDENDTVLADSDVVASGNGNAIFAAWVKQNESPEKEMHDATTYDDLGMMMNATEIYAGTYNGSKWTTTRLTTNNVADMSPTVASSGNRAIVAWRSLAATEMPAENSEQDITTMFNAENNVNYSVWNGSEWTTAQVAYNGAAGTVNAIDSAMLADGTSILVYTVRTGEEITSTETFYTLIDKYGNAVTTGRLTNDSYTDTNAQVTAVNDTNGGYFVLGWYSEHDAGEGKNADGEVVVAHDIRLARINANGSVDARFPESIGGEAGSDISSDFRFSAPANNEELKNVSIVWSQLKDSEIADDAGKYEINAMRFYEAGGTVGVTSATDISETTKNTAVDHFDAYTDGDGAIHVIVLASDYDNIDGISTYDTINLTNLPIRTTNDAGEKEDHLNILLKEPITNIQLGVGTFPNTAIEVTADTNLYELVPGLDLPVQFTVKNTGASVVNNLAVKLGSDEAANISGLSLLPNQSTVITAVYSVPEDKVENVNYTVTADSVEEKGTLVLNRPDVGIYGMKLLSEADGKRTVQVTLTNASGIPLKGSEKTVKLGLYKTSEHKSEDLIGSIIEIKDDTALADIDEGIYGATSTIDVDSLIGNAKEIPDEGIRIFAYAWVEDCDELYTRNNEGSLAFKGLLTKSDGEIITIDSSIEAKTENESNVYVVNADAQNNSLQEQKLGKPVAILKDSEGNDIAQADMVEKDAQEGKLLTFGTEERKNLTATFSAEQLGGKMPVSAVVDYCYKVSFDLNGGSGTFADAYTDTDGHLTLPTAEPTPPTKTPQVFFAGWYTAAENGEKISENTVFTENTTIYAQYVEHQHNWVNFTVDTQDASTIIATCGNTLGHIGEQSATIKINAPALTVYGGAGSEAATITNNISGVTAPSIVYKKGDTVLDAAPTDAGTYTASITLSEVDIGNGQTGNVTASVTYTIDTIAIKGILVDLDDYTYGAETAPAPVLLNNGEVVGGNLTLVEKDDTKSVEYYYKATAFLKSETENIDSLADAAGVFTELTPTTFDVGKHYVMAVITGDNYSNVPYTTQSVFEVRQNTAAVRTAPGTPTVDGTTVTVAAADLSKTLEYSLDGQTWLPVTMDENGQFTAQWPNAVTNAALLLREAADGNYAQPSASAQGSQITTTTFTVTYDANGGIDAPDAATVTKDKTVQASGQGTMTRAGYTFAGWNTAADGSGTAYTMGKTVNTGLTLYAQWTVNTYTVIYDANGGTGAMAPMSFTYDEAQALTETAFTWAGHIFLGWSKTSRGSVQYQDKQTVKNLTDSENVTLYAVWAKDLYNVNGSVQSAETGKIDIELVQGNNSFGSTEVTYDTANAAVPFTLNAIPAGTYNLIAKQGGKTMTVAVIITDDHVALEPITMPEGDTSSVLDVSGSETPAVVVSGLDQLAADEEIDERSVTVTMTVEAQEAGEAAEAAEEIREVANSGSSFVYLDIKITKEIYNEGNLESTETITETGNTLEFVIPFDFSGKSTVKVYRYHDGVAEALTEADTGEEGTYRLDRDNGRIYVYAEKFSTYVIGYKPNNYVPGAYALTILESEHGTVSVSKMIPDEDTEVTVTVTPDEGYELDSITLTKLNGNEVPLTKNADGTYTFTQPGSNVTITATFKEIEKPAKVFFTDVPENSYYYDAVKWAAENGIAQGTSETTFSPKDSTTRAQMVTFLWRAAGEPEPTIAATAFTDIDESAYYYKAVLWAYENGITKGTSETTFSPEATVTRAQSVTFLYRALSGAPGEENPFLDVKDGTYYTDAVKWAAEKGITLGTSATTFSPDKNCLRAQIVTFLYRAYNKA